MAEFCLPTPPVLNRYFIFEQVNPLDDLRMEEIYRLRYQVYCVECGFENPEDHPLGLEHDEFDICSSHFCAISVLSGKIVGTVRVIHATSLGLPIEKNCSLDLNSRFGDMGGIAGEVSRLAISKKFRQDEISRIIKALNRCDMGSMSNRMQLRRALEHCVVAGLYHSLHQYSLEMRLTHWYAVMAKGLPRLLKRNRINWVQIGEEVDYHGRRIPYMRAVRDNLRQYKAA